MKHIQLYIHVHICVGSNRRYLTLLSRNVFIRINCVLPVCFFILICLSFLKEISDLLLSWKHHIDGALLIFVRAPKNRKVLFTSGKEVLINSGGRYQLTLN